MPGPWKAWKSNNSFPTLSTAPWESHRKREIPTFPTPGFAALGKWKTKSRFPTFPPPLATMTLVVMLKNLKTKERKSAAARPPHSLDNHFLLSSTFMLIFQLENAGQRGNGRSSGGGFRVVG